MTFRKTITLTLAGAAMLAATSFSAPARADDGALYGVIAGATALAIIANAQNQPRYRVVDRGYYDAGPDRWHRWHRWNRWGGQDRWHRDWDGDRGYDGHRGYGWR